MALKDILDFIPILKFIFKGARITVRPKQAKVLGCQVYNEFGKEPRYSGLMFTRLDFQNKGNEPATISGRYLTFDGLNKFPSSLSNPQRNNPEKRKEDDRITTIGAGSILFEDIEFEVDSISNDLGAAESHATLIIEFVSGSKIQIPIIFKPKQLQDYYSEVN